MQQRLAEEAQRIQAKEKMLEAANAENLALRSDMKGLEEAAQTISVEAKATIEAKAAELRAAMENVAKLNSELEQERRRSR